MTWFGKLRNVVRQEAQRAMVNLSMPCMGIITHYDPDHYTARVELKPEGLEGNRYTGYLPIAAAQIGNGWGIYSPPALGDMVEVHFQQGGKDAGWIGGAFYNAVDKPLPVPSGEIWIVHKSGTALKFTNDGNVLISAQADLRIEANNIKIHARQTYAFDANGQGQKWDGQGVETWQDDDVTKPHHNHAPPETP